MLWEFNADGTVIRAKRIVTGTCTTEVLEKGTGVATGNNVTVYFTSGLLKFCGNPGSDPYQAKQEVHEYAVERDVLRMRQLNCKYTEQNAIDLYCTKSYDRQ